MLTKAIPHVNYLIYSKIPHPQKYHNIIIVLAQLKEK